MRRNGPKITPSTKYKRAAKSLSTRHSLAAQSAIAVSAMLKIPPGGDIMAGTVMLQELVISSLAQIDALAMLLIEKGVITQQEFLQKISEERATYQKLLNPVAQ
jgi:hypothetical protein